jgi:hypothetical protein
VSSQAYEEFGEYIFSLFSVMHFMSSIARDAFDRMGGEGYESTHFEMLLRKG